jgi:branched-chain amino acid transport system ATP-binding protein
MEPAMSTVDAAVAARAPAVQDSHSLEPAALAVEGVSLSFAGVRALDDVSFRVERGSICGIIGPNGAGKSTLLNVVSGVYRPDAGRVVVGGQALSGAPGQAAALGVARTFQNLALFRGMSVLDNLISGQRLARRSSVLEQAFRLPRARREEDEQRARAEEILAFLHLEPYRDVSVGTLPYGLRKRVELGRALAAEPKLLLLDEPLVGMTAAEKQEMCDVILAVHAARGTTVVLIEHDVGVVLSLSDQVVVLDYGRLIAVGDPLEVAEDPRVVAAYVGAAHEASRGES